MAFGDVRTAARGEWLMERIAARGSVKLREVGGGRAGEMAAHRFLSSPHADWRAVVEMLAERTAKAAAGRRVVVASDWTEMNFGWAARQRDLGPGGDGRSKAFFLHPLLADVECEAVLGVVGAAIWTRRAGKAKDRHRRPPDAKESRRWRDGAECAAAVLSGAARVTMVGDRESDVFDLFAHRPQNVDLIVRARHDRALKDGGRLFAALAAAAPEAAIEVRIAPRGPGDKGRTALVELRAAPALLMPPARSADQDPVAMTLVEAREIDPPKDKTPLFWRLLSSADLPAEEIVRLYRLRWRIEQLFRTLKSDGLKLEESRILDAERLFVLSALALGAAARTIQLVDARDGGPRPATDVLDAAHLPALEAVSRSLEGKTARQKNPHSRRSLAYVAWVAARLGGWNCYYKPPGPKTMHRGFVALEHRLAGFLLARHGEIP
jgi:hypothetical protein